MSWRIEKIAERQDHFIIGLDEGISSYTNNKYILVCRLEKLTEHLNKKYGLSINTLSYEKYKCEGKTERLLRLLKYMHSGEKSREEIAEHFGISERQLNNDLKLLQDGFEFMDCSMQINRIVRKKNTYNSIIHPVFLALRTDEIYALTVGLKLLSRGTVFEQSLSHIADMVYKQLSEYAKEMADRNAEENKIDFEEEDLTFISSQKYMERTSRAFAYFLKEPINCIVTYLENGNREVIRGTMHLIGDSDNFDRILIKSEETCKELDIKDVVRLEPKKGISPILWDADLDPSEIYIQEQKYAWDENCFNVS